MTAKWFGYKCSKCTYEQLNTEGREAIEQSKLKESEE